MDFMIFGTVLIAIYLVLWFFDSFFKSCMHYPYDAFLNGTGLSIRLFRIQWHTTAFNRLTIKWAHNYPKMLTSSFDVGVFVSVLLLPVVFGWHMITLYREATTSSGAHETQVRGVGGGGIQPGGGGVEFELMLPGVNLPLDEIGYYVTALGVCSVVHEIGHALAAVLEDIPVTGFGFNVFLAFAVAYTELGTDQLNSLRTWRRLRVLCAGIWHNVLLAIICFLLMSILPLLFLPFYSVDKSVIVTSIKRDSPLNGENGVIVDDIITHINDCHVTSIHKWYGCLVDTIKHPPAYCIPSEYVLDHDESVPVYHTNDGVTECCDQHNLKNMCFEYMTGDGSHSLIELPQFMCLNVRNTIEHSIDYCHRSPIRCIESFCIKPMMNNATTLMHIKRAEKRDVMFIGHPSDLALTIKVSAFVPKTFLMNANFADGTLLLLKYMVVFSLGLAIVNVIPCFYFDGYHITNTITNHLLQRMVPERSRRDCIAISITSMGTLFFLIALAKSIWHSIFQFIF